MHTYERRSCFSPSIYYDQHRTSFSVSILEYDQSKYFVVFFYAIFRFVATCCCTAIDCFGHICFSHSNSRSSFVLVCLYVFFFSMYFFLYMQWHVVCLLYGIWCNDIVQCLYVAVQQWSTKLLFLFHFLHI